VDESFESLFSYKVDHNFISRQPIIQAQECLTSRTAAAGKYDPEAPFWSITQDIETKNNDSLNNSRLNTSRFTPNLNISRIS
jgi:hypothetical protein